MIAKSAGEMVRDRAPALLPERQRRFRSCVSRFPTGVAVVTFDDPDGIRHGLTISSFTSVSLEPMLVLVSVARRARAHRALRQRPFCVNILGAEQGSLARHFAGEGTGGQVAFEAGQAAPRLAGCLAFLECRPWRSHPAGDHTIFIGEVVDFGLREGDPLAWAPGGYLPLADPVLGMEHLI